MLGTSENQKDSRRRQTAEENTANRPPRIMQETPLSRGIEWKSSPLEIKQSKGKGQGQLKRRHAIGEGLGRKECLKRNLRAIETACGEIPQNTEQGGINGKAGDRG